MARSKRSTGSLHLVAPAPDPTPIGPRLVALREALKLSQAELLRRCRDAAEELGSGYEPFERVYYSAIENGRHALVKYAQRAVIARACGLTTDELSAYLDGRTPLEQVLATRGARAAEAPPLPARVGALRYGDHPRWAEMVETVRQDIDPDITDATFAEVRESPFFNQPLDMLTAPMLAQVARFLQNYRARKGKA